MKHWPFTVIPGEGDKPIIQVEFKGEKKQYTPEQISAQVLVKMKDIAETFIGKPVSSAVSVPGAFPFYVHPFSPQLFSLSYIFFCDHVFVW